MRACDELCGPRTEPIAWCRDRRPDVTYEFPLEQVGDAFLGTTDKSSGSLPVAVGP